MSSANKTFDGQPSQWTERLRQVEKDSAGIAAARQQSATEPRGRWEQSTEPHKELNTPTDDITSVLGFPL